MRRTLVTLFAIVVIVLVGRAWIIGLAGDEPDASSTTRLEVGVNSITLTKGEYSIWWQSNIREAPYPQLGAIEIQIRIPGSGTPISVQESDGTVVPLSDSPMRLFSLADFRLPTSGIVEITVVDDARFPGSPVLLSGGVSVFPGRR